MMMRITQMPLRDDTSWAKTLASLDNMHRSSEAYENKFFELARSCQTSWDRRHLNVFGPEYYYFTENFPAILCGLAKRELGENIRHWLITILYSEMGREDFQSAHFKLFKKLLLDSGLTELEIEGKEHYKETIGLVESLRKIYETASLSYALGAQYMLELQADYMLKQFYCAFVCLNGCHFEKNKPEFFKIHETDELQHQIAMRDCLDCNMARENWSDVTDGASECLKLFSAFWKRLGDETMKINSHFRFD
jgi:pyrroloquinoline quinone (PQQ) biosynthesis protein C